MKVQRVSPFLRHSGTLAAVDGGSHDFGVLIVC
jgi:hypothetical protein